MLAKKQSTEGMQALAVEIDGYFEDVKQFAARYKGSPRLMPVLIVRCLSLFLVF